jgi:predicted GTPase
MTAVLILFGNSAASIPESDKRDRVNGLRETFGLIGAPIRLSMRSGGENPYCSRRASLQHRAAQTAP